MSILVSVDEANFVYIKEKTEASAGNISVQLEKLSKAEYILITKSFKDKRPNTTCKITKKGVAAFEKYVEDLKGYIGQ